MGKRYRPPFKLGMVDQTAWGHWQYLTNRDGVTVMKVAVPEGDDSDLKLAMEGPRLKRAVIMMAAAMASYGHTFTEPFDDDPQMMDAIWAVKQAANLFRVRKDRKGK